MNAFDKMMLSCLVFFIFLATLRLIWAVAGYWEQRTKERAWFHGRNMEAWDREEEAREKTNFTLPV
jgi:hypothetical protein